MAKKIRMTESQVIECMAKLIKEDELNIAYQKPTNGQSPSVGDMQNQVRSAKKTAPNADVNLSVSSQDLNITENKKNRVTYTKAQLKEARRKKLNENSTVYTKQELLNNFKK